jgi:protein-disulfide isomerase
MFKTPIKTTVAALALTTALFTTGLAQAQTPEAMTKEQIEKIIHEYIMNNGEVILKSVDTFQRVTMAQRHTEAVKNNQNELFRNERAPFIGNPDGDVKLVEFFDYNCGYCKRAFADLKGVADTDKNVKIILLELPILGPSSEVAARWALAANKQGKYFAFHQKLMEHQGKLDDAVIEQVAKDVGLDVAKAKTDADSVDVKTQIEKNRALAGQMGIAGTPAFIVGEEVMPGAVDKATLLKKIEEARAKAKAAPKAEDKKPEEKKAP